MILKLFWVVATLQSCNLKKYERFQILKFNHVIDSFVKKSFDNGSHLYYNKPWWPLWHKNCKLLERTRLENINCTAKMHANHCIMLWNLVECFNVEQRKNLNTWKYLWGSNLKKPCATYNKNISKQPRQRADSIWLFSISWINPTSCCLTPAKLIGEIHASFALLATLLSTHRVTSSRIHRQRL